MFNRELKQRIENQEADLVELETRVNNHGAFIKTLQRHITELGKKLEAKEPNFDRRKGKAWTEERKSKARSAK